jgi:hypothetical protein
MLRDIEVPTNARISDAITITTRSSSKVKPRPVGAPLMIFSFMSGAQLGRQDR